MDLSYENRFRAQGYAAIVGVDEVGRGALAGPVVAAAVMLPEDPQRIPPGINDSKKLSRLQREALFPRIVESAVAFGIGAASRAEIDTMNILQATLTAMARAVRELTKSLGRDCDLLLVDGRERCPVIVRQECIINGDALCMSIAAASILAKVTRDQLMLKLHDDFPLFGFDRHVGYGTNEHRMALQQFGPCAEHRISFRGVR